MKFILPTITRLACSVALFLFFPFLAFAGFTTNIPDGAQLTTPQQEVVFSEKHRRAAIGLVFKNRVLLVNGVDRTELTTTNFNWNGSFTVTYAPTIEKPIPQGDVTLDLTIPYHWIITWLFGNTEEQVQLSVYLDSLAPEIARISPAEGEIISDLQTPLRFSISDTGSGVSSESILLFINAVDQTAYASFANEELIYTPTAVTPLPDEPFQVKIKAEDLIGNQNEAAFEMLVDTSGVLSALPIAVPQTAHAPVTIRFVPEITTSNAIQMYEWDFDGDGVYDRSDIIGNSYTWDYTTPGEYNVTLQVTDNLGEVVTGNVLVHILNKAPEISAEAYPSNGEIPLTVFFTVTASDNEGISTYEWDFNGDGTYDFTSATTGDTSHTYTDVGQYSASLKVTDGLGEVSIYTLPTTTVNASAPGALTVTATTNHSSGTVPLTITLGATASDPQNKSFVLWEWDFDGDGEYDYSNPQSATVSHTYDIAGTFYPKVKVTTEDNRSSVDIVEIKVLNSLSLTRDLDTIDLSLDQQAIVTTTLGGATEIQVVIEDRTMKVVRTLVDWAERPGGIYKDTWNGLTDDNAIVPEGAYYAVLNYKEGESVKRLDLRESSGGTRYNPSRNNAARTFSPFDNDPMRITFNLPRSSEVTAFMGYSMSNTRVVTFMSRLPLGTGSHTVLWYGTNNEGVLIKPPPGKYFMFGVWAYNLADNSIYVKSGAHIHTVNAQPPIYDPTTHDENGLRAKSRINFTLTGAASVELQVTDAQSGTLAATQIYPDLPAGENTIEWDGKNAAGDFLAPGKYRLGVRSIGTNGYRSLMEYTLQRIYY